VCGAETAGFLSWRPSARGSNLAGMHCSEDQAPRPSDATHRVIEAILFDVA